MYIYDGIALSPEDFYQKEHSLIFTAIKDLWVARKTIDVLTVADQLTKNNVFDVI